MLCFSLLATPGTEVEDSLGNRLLLTELEPGQHVKVEGRANAEELLAGEIKLLAEDNGFAPIRVTGTVTEIGEDHILVAIIGGALAHVVIPPTTVIRGTLVVGGQVQISGSLADYFSISASRIVVPGLFRLVPDEIHLTPEEVGRVEIVPNQVQSRTA